MASSDLKQVLLPLGILAAIGISGLLARGVYQNWPSVRIEREWNDAVRDARAQGMVVTYRNFPVPSPTRDSCDVSAAILKCRTALRSTSAAVIPATFVYGSEVNPVIALELIPFGDLDLISRTLLALPKDATLDPARDYRLGRKLLFVDVNEERKITTGLCARAKLSAKSRKVESAFRDLMAAARLSRLCGTRPIEITEIVRAAQERTFLTAAFDVLVDSGVTEHNIARVRQLIVELGPSPTQPKSGGLATSFLMDQLDEIEAGTSPKLVFGITQAFDRWPRLATARREVRTAALREMIGINELHVKNSATPARSFQLFMGRLEDLKQSSCDVDRIVYEVIRPMADHLATMARATAMRDCAQEILDILTRELAAGRHDIAFMQVAPRRRDIFGHGMLQHVPLATGFRVFSVGKNGDSAKAMESLFSLAPERIGDGISIHH